MRSHLSAIVAVVVGLVGAACGSSDDGPDDGMELLISYDWDVPPGQQYYCVRETMTEDVVLDAIESLSPPGTHHTVVTWGDPNGPDGLPDGVYECGSYDHQWQALVFESSQGPGRFEFPPGFAHKIPAGMQLSLNFHVLNASDGNMTGTTGTKVRRIDPATVDTWATAIMMGKVSLSVPVGESTHTGQCEMPDDMTIMSVNPHMHSHATHQKVIAHSSEMGDVVIHDEPFNFDEDMFYRNVDPHVPMAKGDLVDVECSYNNTSGDILPWGPDGYVEEMCWTMAFIYPADRLLSPACAN